MKTKKESAVDHDAVSGNSCELTVTNPRTDAKTSQEEYEAVRKFCRAVLRRILDLREGSKAKKAEKRKRTYSVVLTYPPWANRRYLYPAAQAFAERIARRHGDAAWLVADTRPCPDARCDRLFERLTREDSPPLGFHWHGLVLTSRSPDRVRELWVNFSGAAVKPTWVNEVDGRPGRSDFANALARIILYHCKEPPHLRLTLGDRTVASGFMRRLWFRATGWVTADPALYPLAENSPCERPRPDARIQARDRKAVGDPPKVRRCGCGCGESIAHMASHAHYIDAAHRMRAQRGRKGATPAGDEAKRKEDPQISGSVEIRSNGDEEAGEE